MMQKSLREVKGNNEKILEENEQLKDKLQQSKRSIKQNEKLQKQNRALEANLEVLKTEVTKMKEQSRDLQRACTKLKLEKDLLNGMTSASVHLLLYFLSYPSSLLSIPKLFNPYTYAIF